MLKNQFEGVNIDFKTTGCALVNELMQNNKTEKYKKSESEKCYCYFRFKNHFYN